MKQFAEDRIRAGEKRLVIDLGDCSGMDSTFMGSLAGMASKLGVDGGVLQIAEIDARGIQSLEDLGLDSLMEIRPPNPPWEGRIESIRGELAPPRGTATLPETRVRAIHVLKAHETLAATSAENAERFANVITVLRDQVAEPKPPQRP